MSMQDTAPPVDVDSPAYWATLGLDKNRCMLPPPGGASMGEWALHYAAIDIPIAPLCWPVNGECGCHKKFNHASKQDPTLPKFIDHTNNEVGKAPWFGNWQNKYTTDPAKILRWWRHWPNANIGGLMTEKSGFFAVDGDKDTSVAREFLEHAMTFTRVHRTSAPYKFHAIFRRPSEVHITDRNTTECGVNTKGNGQIVLPPSLHKSGARYSILSNLPIAMPSAKMVSLLMKLPLEKQEKAAQGKQHVGPQPGSIAVDALGGLKEPPPYTEENVAWIQSMLNVIPGTISRDDWLNIGRALNWLISGDAAWTETAYSLWDGFSQRFPELYNSDGLATQWRSFHTEGRANPVTLGTLIHLAKQHGWNEPSPPVTVQVQGESRGASEIGVKTPRFSDDHLALEFLVRYQHEVRYVAQWGQWFRFDGQAWRRDVTLGIYDLVRDVCRHIASGAGKAAKGIASAKTRSAVEQLTRADQRIAATVNQWDSDPWLLNTPAGVVDLRTGSTRPHRPDDYMTKITAVAPDFTNRKPMLWLKFLRRIMSDDQERIDFLQRLLGYAITGLTREHILAFLHGKGRNGKGVLLTIVRLILLAYHETAPLDAFYASHHDRHPTELAKLAHARVVTATETQEGRYWDEEKIKALTGPSFSLGVAASVGAIGRGFRVVVRYYQSSCTSEWAVPSDPTAMG